MLCFYWILVFKIFVIDIIKLVFIDKLFNIFSDVVILGLLFCNKFLSLSFGRWVSKSIIIVFYKGKDVLVSFLLLGEVVFFSVLIFVLNLLVVEESLNFDLVIKIVMIRLMLLFSSEGNLIL